MYYDRLPHCLFLHTYIHTYIHKGLKKLKLEFDLYAWIVNFDCSLPSKERSRETEPSLSI